MAKGMKLKDVSNLDTLKPFQRATVWHVYRRMFVGPDATHQFLIADEVGLGKTIVARGIIDCAIHDLKMTCKQINIIYICSNGAIAKQNLSRLGSSQYGTQSTFNRVTLLALALRNNKTVTGSKVNFISLTPRTSFNLKSTSGTIKERALIYFILKESNLFDLPDEASTLFQGRRPMCSTWEREFKEMRVGFINKKIRGRFLGEVKNEPKLELEIGELCSQINCGKQSEVMRSGNRANLIGKLRQILADVSVRSLEPNLIILDEFQRFHNILHEHDEGAKLARKLFGYTDKKGNCAKNVTSLSNTISNVDVIK